MLRPVGIFRKRGEHWVLSFNEKTVRVKTKGVKGLSDIHYLLRHPGKKISASEILLKREFKASNLKENPLIDGKYNEDLKSALNLLREKYKGEKISGNLEEMEETEDKIVRLEDELKKAKGKGRSLRQFTSDEEKHRKNIWKRITHSLNTLKTKHPPLYEHLSKTIVTGVECSYKPDNDPLWQYEDANWTL